MYVWKEYLCSVPNTAFSRSIGADYVNWFAFRAIVCGRIKRQLIRLFHVIEHKIRHFRFNFFVRYQQSGRIVAMNGRVIEKFSLNESWFTFRCILFSRNEIGNERFRLSKRWIFNFTKLCSHYVGVAWGTLGLPFRWMTWLLIVLCFFLQLMDTNIRWTGWRGRLVRMFPWFSRDQHELL